MNKAEQIINYYEENDDFKGNYYHCLLEDTDGAIQRLKQITQGYEFEQFYGCNLIGEFDDLTNDICHEIIEYILDNFETFLNEFNGYYVGYSCLDSVSFGEQEEQIEEHEKQIFEDAGFYVSGEYAYYIVDGGLYIELLNEDIPILRELANKKIKEQETA